MGSTLPSYVGRLAKLVQRKEKVYKEEEFSSRHIAELRDALEQIIELMDQQQREIDQLMDGQAETSS